MQAKSSTDELIARQRLVLPLPLPQPQPHVAALGGGCGLAPGHKPAPDTLSG